MQFTRPDKQAPSKLLPFRSSPATLRGQGGAPDPDQVPHDIAALRRPVPVESFGAPRLQQVDGLAHDARNVITSLSLMAGMMAEPGVLAAKHAHFAGDLESLGHTLSRLIEQLSQTAGTAAQASPGLRPVGNGALGNKEPVFSREPLRGRLPSAAGMAGQASAAGPDQDAGASVKSCERLLAAVAGPAVALHISFERGLGKLALGGDEVTRVLVNLVKNASDAMPSGGRVAITVRKALGADPAALITVQDTGTGIPAHAMGQIFQAGFSSKKPGRRWPATAHHGLGLTIVRELVESVGGSVRVSSTLKKGTTFELKVPCHKGEL